MYPILSVNIRNKKNDKNIGSRKSALSAKADKKKTVSVSQCLILLLVFVDILIHIALITKVLLTKEHIYKCNTGSHWNSSQEKIISLKKDVSIFRCAVILREMNLMPWTYLSIYLSDSRAFSRRFCPKQLTHTMHTMQDAVRNRRCAEGHLDTLLGGARDQPGNPLYLLSSCRPP